MDEKNIKKEGKELVRKNIFLAKEQNEMLRELAYITRKSESELIRESLEQFLKGKEFMKELAEKKRVIEEIMKKM
jgi:predicted transcriptional regulator